LSLRSHDPSLSVALVEASAYDGPRIGEVLPALANVFLKHLDVWDAFQAEGYRPVHGTLSAWGDQFLWENHAIFSTQGSGWHIDRAHFDAFLARETEKSGAEVLTKMRFIDAERSGNKWSLRLSEGNELCARFVVDATGRRAAFARRMGARSFVLDRLAGFARFFTIDNDPRLGTLIEAFPEGWWYTALAGEYRIVTCLTDSDIAQRLSLRERDPWLRLLAETRWISSSVSTGSMHSSQLTRVASSQRIDPVCGEGWLAVGDSASAFDPLSSLGIVKSLRSGVFASYAIADWLGRADARGLARYEKFVQREFAGYRRAHAQYCEQERRWPDSCFWRRRLVRQTV
jgi:flavin-dependent dehydrogenase